MIEEQVGRFMPHPRRSRDRFRTAAVDWQRSGNDASLREDSRQRVVEDDRQTCPSRNRHNPAGKDITDDVEIDRSNPSGQTILQGKNVQQGPTIDRHEESAGKVVPNIVLDKIGVVLEFGDLLCDLEQILGTPLEEILQRPIDLHHTRLHSVHMDLEGCEW